MRFPSGEQIEISAGDQRAVVVEVGGGLRSYTAGRPRRPRRLRRRRDGDRRARPGAHPVAEPDRGRRLRVRRARGISSRSTSPTHATRSTASCAGSPGRSAERERGPRRDGAHAASAARLSVLARARHRVRALRRGPARDATATNIGTRAVPVRERRASVPDGRDADGRPGRSCARPARTVLRRGRARHPDRRGAGRRAPSSTSASRRPIGATRLDHASPISSATTTGSRASSSRDPGRRRQAHALGRRGYPYLMLFTGDRCRRRPPQPRRRADDVSAERFRSGEGADRARARRVGDGRLGDLADVRRRPWRTAPTRPHPRRRLRRRRRRAEAEGRRRRGRARRPARLPHLPAAALPGRDRPARARPRSATRCATSSHGQDNIDGPPGDGRRASTSTRGEVTFDELAAARLRLPRLRRSAPRSTSSAPRAPPSTRFRCTRCPTPSG